MISARKINDCLKGKLLSSGQDIEIDNLLIDSRKITYPETSVFIALKTDRRNAHQFIPELFQQGVRVFIVNEELNTSTLKDSWVICVPDTLVALQQLVTEHRMQFNLPVIGITGSNGKTIVKEWLYQLLEHDYAVVRSPKSFNSQIGVPLSVWQIEQKHTIGIFEAGISQAGEMENLEKIIRPSIGIFTNIGETHNEGFLNVRHKIKEKLKLFTSCETLLYNKDYVELHDCILEFSAEIKRAKQKQINLLTWSKKSQADLQIIELVKKNQATLIKANYLSKEISIQIPFIDDAYIEDSIHCWLTLLLLKTPQTEIEERMSKLVHIAMRLELLKGIHQCTIINDSYNSDVTSFNIALDFLIQQKQHTKKTVILSDIFQSGRENEVYDEIADLLKQKKIQRFIGIGESISRNKNTFRENRKLDSIFYKSTNEFLEAIDTSSFMNESILIKGSRKFEFEKIAKRLQEKIHQTVMEIDLNALLENYKVYQSLLQPGTKIMAMVKAFSYGSGSFEVANKLQFQGADYLAVAYTDEGVALRKSGITLPILVMNPDMGSFSEIIEWHLEPEIYNQHTLLKMIESTVEELAYPIHLKLDTGMHRLGFEEEDLEEVCHILNSNPQLKVVSVFSHLSGSEEAELDEFTKQQAFRFKAMTAMLESRLGYTFLRHLCNSTGIVRHPDLHFDMVRLGLGLYGVDGSQQIKSKLKRVGKMRTIISQIKIVQANETVGYNRKGILNRETKIGTVCVGYADGIPRRLGNGKGKMFVRGCLVPIVGNVCMDMCMLDITEVPEIQEGDQVELFGDEISVNEVATWAETIPYEILTGISQRVKRVYFEE